MRKKARIRARPKQVTEEDRSTADLIDAIDSAGRDAKAIARILSALGGFCGHSVLDGDALFFLSRHAEEMIEGIRTEAKKFLKEAWPHGDPAA